MKKGQLWQSTLLCLDLTYLAEFPISLSINEASWDNIFPKPRFPIPRPRMIIKTSIMWKDRRFVSAALLLFSQCFIACRSCLVLYANE